MPDLVRRGARAVCSASLEITILASKLTISLVLLVGAATQIVAAATDASLLTHTVSVLRSGQEVLQLHLRRIR